MNVPVSETVLLVTRNGMGDAEPALQQKLMGTYLQLLDESDTRPAAICFYASGVHLAAEGSPVLDALKALEAKGVRMILCSTCLNYYGLSEKIAVGIVGGMTDIIEAQIRATKVISL